MAIFVVEGAVSLQSNKKEIENMMMEQYLSRLILSLSQK